MRIKTHHLTIKMKTIIQLILLLIICMIGHTQEGKSQIIFIDDFKVEKESFTFFDSEHNLENVSIMENKTMTGEGEIPLGCYIGFEVPNYCINWENSSFKQLKIINDPFLEKDIDNYVLWIRYKQRQNIMKEINTLIMTFDKSISSIDIIGPSRLLARISLLTAEDDRKITDYGIQETEWGIERKIPNYNPEEVNDSILTLSFSLQNKKSLVTLTNEVTQFHHGPWNNSEEELLLSENSTFINNLITSGSLINLTITINVINVQKHNQGIFDIFIDDLVLEYRTKTELGKIIVFVNELTVKGILLALFPIMFVFGRGIAIKKRKKQEREKKIQTTKRIIEKSILKI
ncbi:MAG: hypothetical protein ACXAC7_17180 [Candidatus Hodarchaeales archaeon]